MTPKRVLVVDDNVLSTDSLALVLRHWGYDVSVAYDGPSGLEVALAVVPDVAILDIELPSMSGFELARHLRREPTTQAIWLVALTGHDWRDLAGARDRSDFDLHLRKPVRLEELQRLLARRGRALSAVVGGGAAVTGV